MRQTITYAGYMQWKHADFGLNPQHPPLVKFLATMPLLNMHLKVPPLLDRPYRLQEVIGGRDFVFQNDANAILSRARMAASVLTLLLAVLVFLAAQEMFRTGAGFIALGLICFDPTLLGHSALVTTDAGQACFMFWAIYTFYRYVKAPSPRRLIMIGLVAGLALASKHSAVLLFPMLVLLAVMELACHRKLASAQPTISLARYTSRMAFALVFTGVVSLAILWSCYGFRYAARGERLPLNPAMPAMLQCVPGPFEAKVLGEVDKLPLLPEPYTYPRRPQAGQTAQEAQEVERSLPNVASESLKRRLIAGVGRTSCNTGHRVAHIPLSQMRHMPNGLLIAMSGTAGSLVGSGMTLLQHQVAAESDTEPKPAVEATAQPIEPPTQKEG